MFKINFILILNMMVDFLFSKKQLCHCFRNYLKLCHILGNFFAKKKTFLAYNQFQNILRLVTYTHDIYTRYLTSCQATQALGF